MILFLLEVKKMRILTNLGIKIVKNMKKLLKK